MVQGAMAFSVWPSLHPFAAAALEQIPRAGASDDESFWASVRAQFELTPEFTNLVSVVRGNFTKTNREKLPDYQLPAPLPDLSHEQETRRKVASFTGASPQNIAVLRNTTEGVTTVLSNWPNTYGSNWKHAG
jgi:hypothetical protein